jgi:adenine-specific DNA-methyltransferase
MSASFPFYLLNDSVEGRQKEADITGVAPPDGPTNQDVKKGFVLKRMTHTTLSRIVNNPEIREGMTSDEIDAAIARHAERELLFDQPYEDNKRVRVTGRFTVESLSPHRVLDPAEQEQPDSESAADRDPERLGYVPTILANLRKAGVQNRIKDERLVLDTLEPYAGEWLHAKGTFTDKEGESRRVAVSIGPEHGTVGPLQIKNAAIEAVKGIGHDVLIVCGFAFDAQADETAKEFGELAVLPARMNPDLIMGDELLKKTGTANLFMVFGEPDINIKEEGGQLIVELRGLDVYDPTTGEIRSNSTDDIACWFIDTNYNRESFFVRHAYFTGAGDPYDRLKRALRAEIDEEAWSTLYSTTSRPFPKPDTGRIAVKAINHYGDEVMKVFHA